MWKKAFKYSIPLTICLILVLTSVLVSGCGGGGTTKTEIVIGASRDINGPQAIFQAVGFAPIYKMWIDEVNAAGGIDVGGKKLLVRLIEYDDSSDPAVCVRNLEKLCTEDNVDFLFGPTGTAMLFAAAPIANKYKRIMICGEGGCTTLTPKMGTLPYVFSVLNYSDHFQIPMFADICNEVGAKTAYIMYMSDLHGAEYNLTAQSEFTLKGISVVGTSSIPISITDMDPIIKEAKALNPDIFCAFVYPNQNILFMQTAMALEFNPKIILLGPGGNFQFFSFMFADALQGVMFEGAWNSKSSPQAGAFAEKLTATVGAGNEDWWGAIVYYASLQFFKQAIEKAGTLDNAKVRDAMSKEKFETVIGPMWWDCADNGKGGGLLPQECYAGQIGQWQSGFPEVIDVGSKRTAAPIYPKPPFPKS